MLDLWRRTLKVITLDELAPKVEASEGPAGCMPGFPSISSDWIDCLLLGYEAHNGAL